MIHSDDIKMIYSYCGLYGNVLETDIDKSYPEALLAMYQSVGVNAVWLPVVLYQLTPFPFDVEYSVGWEKRQERLRELIARAEKFGIKVFLYINEPRCMPLEFYNKYPELKGTVVGQYASMCQSDARVIQYLRDSIRSLCTNIPKIGGFFTITFSENLTHCKSLEGELCSRCKHVESQKLAADVICAISEESRSVDPNIRTIAWTWGWNSFMSKEQIRDLIDRLPKEVILQCTSEENKEFCIGGIKGNIADYTLSMPGPGNLSKETWDYARKRGMEVSAKVQINNTWECSTVPFLPVFDLIRENVVSLKNAGVKHMMLSWTLGGYPSASIKVAMQCFGNSSEEAYRKLLLDEYGDHADSVQKAVQIFSEAFREFPFHLGVLYTGPQNAGPSNLLYKEPTGFEATMTCYSYDDIKSWSSIYPEEIYINQLRKLSHKWRDGLIEIEGMPQCEFKDSAWMGYALFYSSYLQADFIINRRSNNTARMCEILMEEEKLARMTYKLMLHNNLIGYEAANHYYFTKSMLAEKVICCRTLYEDFSNK